MSSIFTVKALGLNVMPNQLEAEPGSLSIAKNVVINRDSVVEPRRGMKIYGNSFGSTSDRAKQLINYKNRILRHYGTTLQFDNGSGTFTAFSGSYSETDVGLRIKSIESNGNLYFTTSDGIMKISAKTADDFSTSSGFITKAGAVKATDISADVVYNYGDQSSFLVQDSAVAYRVVWGYRDLNNNLFLGTPSQRVEVYNYLNTLMLQDFMFLLQGLDNIGQGGSMISDKNYINTLKLTSSASPTDLRDNLLLLVAKIDNDILYADNVAVAPLQISTSSITSGVCTINFVSGDPSTYVSAGSKIKISGFSPASGILDGAQVVTTVNSTSLTFNTSASGVVTVSGSATINSNEYSSITQPAAPDVPATDDELVALQDYILAIIDRLNVEPTTVISAPLSAAYIAGLDITKASTVSLDISIPQDINSSYFFQIYRSSTFEATGVQVLGTDVFPNDELQLVYEAFPTDAEITAGTATVVDVVPDAFRGANLYTNASTGEGILQANDLPPLAKDINVFKNSVFYANTKTRYRKSLSLLGVQTMIDDYNNSIIPTLTIATSTSSQTYTFVVGTQEALDITCGNGASLNSSGTGSYFDVNSGNNKKLYRFWYKIGTAVAPSASGRTLVAVEATAGDTSTQIAEKTRDVINIYNTDFTATSAINVISVECVDVGYTTDASAGTSGFTITVTNQGIGEDASLRQVLLSSDISPARAVEQTAQSLTRVINKDASGSIYVYYISGAQEVPGQMTFEAKGLNNGQFYMMTNNENTGNSFNPTFAPSVTISSISTGSPSTMLVTTSSNHGLQNLDYIVVSGSNCTPSIDGYKQITYVSPTTFRVNATITIAGTSGGLSVSTNTEYASNEESPNRIYYSKSQQPESVPILNYLEVGAKDKAILRIFPLRDSLFVFKEDGLYRISGESIPFNLALFDTSCILVAPDSVSSVDNVIYGWTRQGVASVTESGTRNVSRPLDIQLLPLASPNYPDFSTATWGVGYESDKSYSVFTVSKTTDDHATIGYKYNSLTNTWTTIDKEYTCGVINFIDDRLYVGCGDINNIEQERKGFSREDYADREYEFEIGAGKYLNKVISLDSVTNIEASDVFVQYQTVTVYDFNMLLKKLDIDPGVVDTNYFSTLKAVPGSDMRAKLLALATKLDADSGVTDTDYLSTINNKSGSITAITAGTTQTITSAAHGLFTGRVILIAGSNSSPTINGEYEVTVINANTFSITGVSVINPGTSGSFSTVNNDFNDLKACYNKLVVKLNADSGVGFSNYTEINKITTQEILVSAVNKVAKRITVLAELDYVVGPFTIFKSINCEVQYSPNTFGGDPISLKHIRECQILFESLAFTEGTISFATDLLPKFEKVPFIADGNGRFGFEDFGESFFGGASNSAPIRTYIPRNCQRCRYMVIKFNHRVAREKWSLYGITLTGETELSTRSYK